MSAGMENYQGVSMRTGTVYAMAVQRMACTACGSEANASCNCGKPYVPKRQQAREAIEANPRKSNRAIADEIGVGEATVRRARDETASGDAVEREGMDGKVRRLPVRNEEPEDDDVEPDNRRGAFILRADQARVLAVYTGPTDAEILKFALAAAQAWQDLAAELQRKMEH